MIITKPHGRHEQKYLLSYAEYLALAGKIRAVLDFDKHAGKDGYFIRSIYFDDIQENAYYEKAAGIYHRKKYRIRSYNNCPDYITLECKEKFDRWIVKTSAVIDQAVCASLIQGDFSVIKDRKEQIAKDFYFLAYERGMKPSVIVDYDREAFVHPASNLRITFDKNLHAGGLSSFEMFEKEGVPRFTLPIYMNNSVILEVKYDTYFPEFLRNIIPTSMGMPLSISKYCLCKEVNRAIKY